jgi:tetratricopeptide (TPR) repeat protein
MFHTPPKSFHKSMPIAAVVLAGLVGIVATCLIGESAWGQTQYGSAREAYAAGAKLFNMRKYAEGREPFEAALKLSDDLPFQVRVYRALMQSYRQLPEVDKMLEATEFIFEHGESAVEKSLIARDLASFAHQRGKTQEIADRYEKRLKQAPEDRPALYTLTQLYDRALPNPARRAELQLVLNKVRERCIRDV